MKSIFFLVAIALLSASCVKDRVQVKQKTTSFHTDHLDGYDFINISDSLTPSYEWNEFDTIHNCGTSTNFILNEDVSYFIQLRHSQNGFNLWTGYVKRNGTAINVNQINGSKTLTFNCGGVLFIN